MLSRIIEIYLLLSASCDSGCQAHSVSTSQPMSLLFKSTVAICDSVCWHRLQGYEVQDAGGTCAPTHIYSDYTCELPLFRAPFAWLSSVPLLSSIFYVCIHWPENSFADWDWSEHLNWPPFSWRLFFKVSIYAVKGLLMKPYSAKRIKANSIPSRLQYMNCIWTLETCELPITCRVFQEYVFPTFFMYLNVL